MAAKRPASTTKRSSTNNNIGGSGGSGGGGYGGGGGGEREPPGEEPENLDIHEAYLQHRLGGGEQPTTQAYARAFNQFKNLLGAVRGKPALKPPNPPKEDEDEQTDGTGEKP
jgi:hypothetical protein